MSVRDVVAGAALEAEALEAEGARILQICNACRYCEGYCAVFPAMERRAPFDRDSLAYLSNLCHHCGACLYACQYAPPHEFAVNVPRTFAKLRRRSYEAFAWPRAFAVAYRNNGTLVSLALAGAIVAFLLAALAMGGRAGIFTARSGPGSFYAIFPHGFLVAVFGLVFLHAIVAMAIGGLRFRRAIRGPGAQPHPGDAARAVEAALALSNLEGGGEGCYVKAGIDHPPTSARRWFHHFTFYGFLACFASTSLATVFHYAYGWEAPYAWSNPVVILGTLGGIGLVVGPIGLLALKGKQDPDMMDAAQQPMDKGFLWLLLLTSVTGLAVLVWRETAAMQVLLAVHLGVVLALFLTLPYGKFVHGLYRYLALSEYEREKRTPVPEPLTKE